VRGWDLAHPFYSFDYAVSREITSSHEHVVILASRFHFYVTDLAGLKYTSSTFVSRPPQLPRFKGEIYFLCRTLSLLPDP